MVGSNLLSRQSIVLLPAGRTLRFAKAVNRLFAAWFNSIQLITDQLQAKHARNRKRVCIRRRLQEKNPSQLRSPGEMKEKNESSSFP